MTEHPPSSRKGGIVRAVDRSVLAGTVVVAATTAAITRWLVRRRNTRHLRERVGL